MRSELIDGRHLARRAVIYIRQSTPHQVAAVDRKSTRLNSSHMSISYAVFCLKKKRIGFRRCWSRRRSFGPKKRDTTNVFSFFRATRSTKPCALPLHDALPIPALPAEVIHETGIDRRPPPRTARGDLNPPVHAAPGGGR